MAVTDPSILARLRSAREAKPKKEKQPLKREKPLEKGAPLKRGQRSEKMKGIMAAIRPLYADFLEKKPVCEINSPECTQTATCVHHTAGRGIAQIMNIKSWKASCDACNYYVEKHHQWALERGFKVSRHQ